MTKSSNSASALEPGSDDMRKRSFSAFLLAGLLTGWLLAGGNVSGLIPSAQAEIKPPLVAVVDTQKIQQEAMAAKGIRKQLEAQQDVYQKEIDARQEKLKAVEQELLKQRAVLSQDTMKQKRTEFEKQVADLQKLVQDRRKMLDQTYAQAMGSVNQAMQQSIDEVARSQGATMVLFRQSVMWMADRSADITDVVLERLNARLPEVAVSLPAK